MSRASRRSQKSRNTAPLRLKTKKASSEILWKTTLSSTLSPREPINQKKISNQTLSRRNEVAHPPSLSYREGPLDRRVDINLGILFSPAPLSTMSLRNWCLSCGFRGYHTSQNDFFPWRKQSIGRRSWLRWNKNKRQCCRLWLINDAIYFNL